jgi:hypothetical protein
VGKALLPIPVNLGTSQDINIIERPMIFNVNMDEHALVNNNGCIVH